VRREHWPVGEYGIRPAGKPTHCFYCGEPKGGSHAVGCVIRSRTVVVDIAFTLTMEMPEDWTEEQIAFKLNESSSCASNIVDLLAERSERADAGQCDCLCDQTEATFLREATAEDEARDALFVAKLPS